MIEELEEQIACVHVLDCEHCQACQYGRRMEGGMAYVRQNIGTTLTTTSMSRMVAKHAKVVLMVEVQQKLP